MSERDFLNRAINNNDMIAIKVTIGNCTSVDDAEGIAYAILTAEKSTTEMIDAVLQNLLKAKENARNHGYWVHAVSHLTKYLWDKKLISWIAKFNEEAFAGANLGDTSCSDRLMGDFSQFAEWHEDPKKFGITSDSLRWAEKENNNEYFAYALSKVLNSPFSSEADFLAWHLRQPKTWHKFDGDSQTDLVNSAEIKSILQKLSDLGIDISEFRDLEKSLLLEKAAELKKELSAATSEWRIKRISKGIIKTKEALVSLGLNKKGFV